LGSVNWECELGSAEWGVSTYELLELEPNISPATEKVNKIHDVKKHQERVLVVVEKVLPSPDDVRGISIRKPGVVVVVEAHGFSKVAEIDQIEP
jgi:hypothetical protein